MARIFGIRPEFLALDQNGDGTDGRDGRDGRTEYSFTVLLGRRNTVYSFYRNGKARNSELETKRIRNEQYSLEGHRADGLNKFDF